MPLPSPLRSAPTSSDLVQQARDGDQQAWSWLYRIHANSLRRYIGALTTSVDVEDVLSDVWEQAIRDIHALRSPTALDAWLRAIARHTTYRASAQARRELPSELPDMATGHPGLDESLVAQEDTDRVWRALDQTPPRTRELLERRLVKEEDAASTAAALDIAVESVYVGLSRGRQMLRATYDRLPLLLPPWIHRLLRRSEDSGATAQAQTVALATAAGVVLAAAVPVALINPAPSEPSDLPSHDRRTVATVQPNHVPQDAGLVRHESPPLDSVDEGATRLVGTAQTPTHLPPSRSEPREEVAGIDGVAGAGFHDGDPEDDHGQADVDIEYPTGGRLRVWIWDSAPVEEPASLEPAPHSNAPRDAPNGHSTATPHER